MISGTTASANIQGLTGTYFNLLAAQNLNQSAEPNNSAWLGNQTPAVTARLVGPIDFPDIADNGFADSMGDPVYYNIGSGSNINLEARWYGEIMIPGSGTAPIPINFATTSDGGSMLSIDGKAVVDNNNVQGSSQATDIANLTPGLHIIDVEYDQVVSSASMDVQWDPTGGSHFVDIPNSAFVEYENALLKMGTGTLTLSNADTYIGLTAVDSGKLVVNGQVLNSPITISASGTLEGNGSVPAADVQSGGFLAPGNSPGTLTAMNLALGTGASFMEQLGGASAGTEYDQTVVPAGGSVVLGGATLNVSFLNGFAPTIGQQFTLIANRSGASVVGTFSQGSTLTLNGSSFEINYAGGAGHDVVLTAVGPTTTTLSAVTTPGASSDSSLFGQSVTFRATVTANPSGSEIPTGTVIFKDGPTILETVSLSHGSASLNTSTLGVGVHTITADFMGDDGWLNSANSLMQTVNRAPTMTTVATSPANPVAGQSINFTATVGAIGGVAGTPTGAVAFYVDGAQVGTSAIEVVDGVSTAMFQEAALSAGSHEIAAAYSGDPTFAAGTPVSTSLTISPTTSTGGNSPGGSPSGSTPDKSPPRLTQVSLSGSKGAHSTLVLQFSEALDPTRAVNLQNYAVLHGRRRRVKILSIAYNPVAWTVTLRTRQRINPHGRYQLKVNGGAPSGLISSSGVFLDGNGTGVAGTSAVRIIN